MNRSPPDAPAPPRLPAGRSERSQVGLAVFAVCDLAPGGVHGRSPRTPSTRPIGPFDTYNPHYLRDVASFEAALGVGLAVAISPPLLARAGAGASRPSSSPCTASTTWSTSTTPTPPWTGYFDFFSLLAATVAAGLAVARRAAAADPAPRRRRSRLVPSPTAERSIDMSRIEGVPEQGQSPGPPHLPRSRAAKCAA